MKVAVAYNTVAAGEADPATLDVLDQVRYVCDLLTAAGHVWTVFPCGRNVDALFHALCDFGPDRIFNLVESVEGHATLHPCAAALWDLLGIPYTGSSSRALALTTDKHLAKQLLRANGLPTPDWAVCAPGDTAWQAWQAVPGPWILKPALEDGSLGIDEDSVVREASAVDGKLRALQHRFPGQLLLVEHFVDGREFNVALLGAQDGPIVLPPAELRFRDYPPGKERVAGFRAKWDRTSFECHHLERTFDFPPGDAPLLARIRDIELRCWLAFGLSGYARVDLRVDREGQAFVLEVNANPCLSPDAGFVAAVARAGLPPTRMLELILEDCVRVPS